MISTLRRQLAALAVVAVLFLFVACYLTFDRLAISDGVRSFIGGSTFEKYVGDVIPSTAGDTLDSSPNAASTVHDSLSITLPPPPARQQKVLVAARTKTDNVSWIFEELPEWPTAIYSVDDDNATLSTHRNKGHEASAYLTYIIDHYEQLPEIVLFIHSHQKHKHGTKKRKRGEKKDKNRVFEGIDYDNLESIRALNLDFVKRNGFTNLRCMAHPGCPAEIQPFRPESERIPLRPQEEAMAQAWWDLFQDANVPHVLAAPCCAQFAVPGAQIRRRKKEEYERFLDWLYTTPLDDFTSGRVFEYLWHVIFGKEAVYCPSPEQCYADQYHRSP